MCLLPQQQGGKAGETAWWAWRSRRRTELALRSLERIVVELTVSWRRTMKLTMLERWPVGCRPGSVLLADTIAVIRVNCSSVTLDIVVCDKR